VAAWLRRIVVSANTATNTVMNKKESVMIFWSYVALIFCALVVGGCAGGILGKLSISKADPGLMVVLGGGFIFQLIAGFLITYLKHQTGNENSMTVYGIVALIFAVLAFYGARRGPA